MSDQVSREAQRLDLTDIRFLKAVRDILQSPEEFEGTEEGETSATTSAIRDACGDELTDSQIQYRLRRGENSRQFDSETGVGYLQIYDPKMTETGFGPKSCDITEKGLRVLAKAQEVHGLLDRETSKQLDHERMAEVEAAVDELSEQVEQMSNQQERILEQYGEMQSFFESAEESEFGAVDPEQAERLQSLQSVMIDFVKTLDILGIDFKQVQSLEDLTEENRRHFREAILKTLFDSEAAETVLIGDGVQVDTGAGDGDVIEADSSSDNRPLDSHGDGEGEPAETESDAE